jgi:hypothetical protein
VSHEQNTARYEIERSIDGISLLTAATVVAANAHNYNFTDKNLAGASNFLSLKINRLPNSAAVSVYNSNGMLVLSKRLMPGLQQLDVRHLPAGVYQLKKGVG